METISKLCRRCNTPLPLSEFYKRPNSNSYTSECKTCMKSRSKAQHLTNEDYQVPVVESEKMAIEYLHSNGIPALPGKTIRMSFVDVIAFGCIGVEVKYSPLVDGKFIFKTTPSQQKHGFRADVVMLICDYGDRKTFHLFPAKHPVFYMGERLKTGFTFTPGAYEPLKHGENRVVMVQGMMDWAQDDLRQIYTAFRVYRKALKRGA